MSAASGSKTAGSSAAAFDDAYDLGEDDEQRAQRPPLSLRDFSGRLEAPVTGRPRRPLSNNVVDEFRKIRKTAGVGVEAGIAERLGDGQ